MEGTNFFCAKGNFKAYAVKENLDLWWPPAKLKLTGPAQGSHPTELQPEIFRLDPTRAVFDFWTPLRMGAQSDSNWTPD